MAGPREYEAQVVYPDGPEDHEGIIRYMRNLVEAQSAWRQELNRNSMRNILYSTGNQWLTYDLGLQAWRPMGIRKSTPRPITNRIGPLVGNTVSRLIKNRPPLTYRPGGIENEDVVAAGVADNVLSIIERETRIRHLKPQIARWLCTTGNVFLVNSYDNGAESGLTFVQSEQCVECGTANNSLTLEENEGDCPECGAHGPFKPAQDDEGVPVGEHVARGRHYTELKTLFSSLFDPECRDIYESPYFAISETMNEDHIIQQYGSDSLIDVGREDSLSSEALGTFYLSSLAYISPGTQSGESPYTAGGEAALGNRIKMTRLWLKPRYDKAPRGIYCVILGDRKVIEAKEFPYKDDQGKPFLNVVHGKFDNRAGSSVGRTRLDDLIPKQDERNLIESHFMLHTRRMSNAAWLIPTGSGIQKVTGETGPVYNYQPVPGAPPPSRIAGVNPPEFLIRWMDMIDQEMDIMWGTFEIGRGQVPERGSDLAFVSLQMLAEKAEEAQSEPTENWALMWMEWANQHLHIWREFAEVERTLAVGGGKWAVEKFNNARLAGGVDIDVEVGQFRPRSHIAMRGTIQQLFNWGVLNPQDPQMAFRLYQLMGMPELMEDFRLDWNQANQENDMFKEWAETAALQLEAQMALAAQGAPPIAGAQEGAPPGGPPAAGAGPALGPVGQPPPMPVPPPMPWENQMVHLSIHRQFIMSDFFRELDQMIQQPMLQHMLLHQTLVAPPPRPAQGSVPGEEEGKEEKAETNREGQPPEGSPQGQEGPQ